MIETNRRVSLICMVFVMALLLTACSSSEKSVSSGGSTTAAAKTLNATICAGYVSEAGSSAVAEQLKEMLGGDVNVSVACISTTSEDPMMQMTSIMKITMGIAAREIDIVIADAENAARNARSEAFCPLSDLLSEEQIAALGDKALSFDMVDEDGKPTGERTSICGIDITDSGITDDVIAGKTNVGLFVVSNAPNMERYKILINTVAENLRGKQ